MHGAKPRAITMSGEKNAALRRPLKSQSQSQLQQVSQMPAPGVKIRTSSKHPARSRTFYPKFGERVQKCVLRARSLWIRFSANAERCECSRHISKITPCKEREERAGEIPRRSWFSRQR
jgi:hypothetical protein